LSGLGYIYDMTELAEWDSFYLIVGGASGALIGLQFVVMTLIAGSRPRPQGEDASAAFGTPTVVHFAVALLLSALIRAPWKTVTSAATAWGILGFAGVVYTLIVIRRMVVQNVYNPEFEDWLCHAVIPFIAYAALGLSALGVFSYERTALFGVGFSALLLLFVGIHNAWDTVTYHVYVKNLGDLPEPADDANPPADGDKPE
jgi:hypothetical protein